MARKQQLRNEHRKSPKRAPRREIGRTPNWVYQERREAQQDGGSKEV
ncbi:hypothetical protein phiRKBJ001_94 [Streptomyces phage phiRKBJ001]|nr:hypothetical protein phiRKBJ001_94 [Streptomyces phage phiRKBJ001]